MYTIHRLCYVYGIHNQSQHKKIFSFRNAAELFLGAISTFTSYELMDYDKFIKLAVITSMLALPRPTLREKICQGSEIAEVLHDDPATKQYLFSFYNSQFQTVISLNRKSIALIFF